MKLDRFRGPALAAAAVLLISGAGIASAGTPSAAVSAPVAPAVQPEPTGPDTDTLQEGDQTTPDVAGSGESAAEPTGPDTDTLQEGDQTTPDVAGATSASNAVAAPTVKAAEKAAPETAPEGTEAPGTESDGPGGHEDPAGQNVDHQFNGEE
jgi:hypothetical protein